MRRRYLGAAMALALATALGVVALAPTAGAGTTRTYIVLYKQLAVATPPRGSSPPAEHW